MPTGFFHSDVSVTGSWKVPCDSGTGASQAVHSGPVDTEGMVIPSISFALSAPCILHSFYPNILLWSGWIEGGWL